MPEKKQPLVDYGPVKTDEPDIQKTSGDPDTEPASVDTSGARMTNIHDRVDRIAGAVAIPKNPELHELFVKNDDASIAEMERQGYRIAKPNEISKHSGVVRDGKVIRDDRVVMVTSKENYEDICAIPREIHQKMEEASHRDDAMHGVEERENHSQRVGKRYYSIP